jgi:hypothetical protein
MRKTVRNILNWIELVVKIVFVMIMIPLSPITVYRFCRAKRLPLSGVPYSDTTEHQILMLLRDKELDVHLMDKDLCALGCDDSDEMEIWFKSKHDASLFELKYGREQLKKDLLKQYWV